MSKIWPVLLFLLLASPATSQSELEQSDNASTKSSTLIAFFHEPFQQPLGHSLFSLNAKGKILERFGDPISESSSQYAARTSDEQIWGTKLDYSGITFVIGESEDRSETWLQSIDVRGKEHILSNGLRIGSSRSDVVEAFRDSRYTEYDGALHFSAEIFEDRGELALGTAMELQVDIGDDGLVTRFLIESIEL